MNGVVVSVIRKREDKKMLFGRLGTTFGLGTKCIVRGLSSELHLFLSFRFLKLLAIHIYLLFTLIH